METPLLLTGQRAGATRAPFTASGRMTSYADRRLMELATRHRADRETLPVSERTDEIDERD